MATYTIPGVALRILEDNGHTTLPAKDGDVNLAEAGHAFAAAEPVKKGFGTRHQAELTEDQYEALCDYFDTLADLLRHMTTEERGSDNEIYACEAALKSLIPDY